MTSPSRDPEKRGILRWLGFGGDRQEPETPVIAARADGDEENADVLRERRRRQMLADVASFLTSHRLEVTAYTLTVAHDIVTGADQTLARLIEQRVAMREPVTLRWLEQVARDASTGENGMAKVGALMERVEGTIDRFGETARAACTATSAYTSVLSAHVDELGKVDGMGSVNGPGKLVSEISTIAGYMLGRTRELEQAMQRSDEETAALRQELADARREAAEDHLTGLPNRRAFEVVLAREYAVSRKSGEPLCVAFCDIDNFKRINDQHGHEAGDRVLREVALALAGISGDRCHVARHGGEEFVVLFSGLSVEAGSAVLDGTREALARRRMVNRANDRPFGRITFSAGVADVLAADTPREALRAADHALLRAKAEGRNRICCDDTLSLATAAE